MKRIMLVTLLLVSLAGSAMAQALIDPIRIWADGSSYLHFQDRTKSYVEIYCAFQRADFQFEDKNGAFEAIGFLYVEAFNKDGVLADSSSRFVVMSVEFLEDAYKKDVRIFEVLPLLLEPGKYSLKVTAMDATTKRSGIATFEVNVKDFSGDGLMMSDLEMAYDIEPEDTTKGSSSLIKANRRILPNPNRYFSNEDSLIYFYAEVYNLSEKAVPTNEFTVQATLHDAFGYELRRYALRTHKKPGATAVLTDAVPVKGVPGGAYELHLEIKDLATGLKTSAAKRFMMIYGFEQLSPTMSDSAAFTQNDAILMEQVIKYISSAEEKAMYRDLDLEGKKAFLAQFWDRKNPKQGSPVNEFKNEVFRRFAYANQYYSTAIVTKDDGWKTDRGRVYITYGEPDNITRHPSSMGQKPYEVWTYYRLPGQAGNDICYFVDLDGYGNYRLVHSSIRGEISNPEWESKIENDQLR
ncbi:MAG: GWxTD domain-containing protein [bacterium]|nr:GWxTD domain-containing protein [bacterium]